MEILTVVLEALREKCQNAEVFLVRIFPHLDRISPYSVQIRENTYQKNFRIWTLFTQWKFQKIDSRVFHIEGYFVRL